VVDLGLLDFALISPTPEAQMPVAINRKVLVAGSQNPKRTKP
jgi:hypothetical protein